MVDRIDEHEQREDESDCIENRQLLAELEIEILQFLQALDRQPGRQARMMDSRRQKDNELESTNPD